MVVAVAPEEIAALLAVPPDEFVAARTARVRELKAGGQKDVAAALGKVRKPRRLVWIVGEIARRHPDLAASAVAVAVELAEAQAGGGGVRPLLKRFRDVVAQVAERADELDGPVDRLEVGLALREVLADADGRAAWIGGHLLALPGDEEGPVAVAAPTGPPGTGPRRSTPSARAGRRGADEHAEDDAAARAAEEEARRAHQDEVAAARAAIEDLEARVAAADEARPGQLARLEALERELEQLQMRVADSQQALDDDDAATEELRGELDERRSALAELEERGPERASTAAAHRTRRRRS